MDKAIQDGFNEICKDLESEFENHFDLKVAKVGKKYNPPDPKITDYTEEDGQFKFKIYINNMIYIIVRPFEKIEDYPTSNQKKDFINTIINEVKQKIYNK